MVEPPAPTYTVYCRFRQTRLILRRGITSKEEALAFAESARAIRFHDREAVFVVDDDGGRVVEEPAAPRADDRPARAGASHIADALERAPATTVHDRRQRVRGAVAAAREAQTRYERALARFADALPTADDELVDMRATLEHHRALVSHTVERLVAHGSTLLVLMGGSESDPLLGEPVNA